MRPARSPGIWLAVLLVAGCTQLSGTLSGENAPGHISREACRQTVISEQTPIDHQLASTSGIGGTGIHRLTSDSTTGGIGGTGIQTAEQKEGKTPPPGGIGGTGISGMVTAFGSICVNGFKIDYQPQQVQGEAPLAIGQVVNVVADTSNHAWVARRVVQEILVSGPIIEFSPGQSRLSVMQQQVVLDPAVRVVDKTGQRMPLNKLAISDQIYVSGFRRHDGAILATFIGESEPKRAASIIGPATAVGDRLLMIGGQIISYPDDAGVKLPARINVSGIWSKGELQVDTVQTFQPFAQETLSALSIQGFVHPVSAQAISLNNGTHVDTGADQARNLQQYSRPVIIDAVSTSGQSFKLDRIFLLDIDGGDGGGGNGDSESDHDSHDGDDGGEGNDGSGEDGSGDGSSGGDDD